MLSETVSVGFAVWRAVLVGARLPGGVDGVLCVSVSRVTRVCLRACWSGSVVIKGSTVSCVFLHQNKKEYAANRPATVYRLPNG